MKNTKKKADAAAADTAKTHARMPTPPVTAVPDLFGGAAKTDKVFTTKKTSKGKERDTVSLGPDLDKLAAFRVLIDALEGSAEQLKEELKEKCLEEYADRAVKGQKHPSSFRAEGEVASASVEMRCRGSNMPINDEEILSELRQHDISLQKNLKVPERFVFNDEFLAQENIRKAISEAFSAHPVLAPIAGELIKKQQEEFTWSTTEATLDEAAKNLSEEDYVRLVPYLSTLALGKFHLDGAPIAVKTKGESSVITQEAKSLAIGMLQEMGVLPLAATARKK